MGIDLNGMMAEIMGKANGVCKGKGGSMHIADVDAGTSAPMGSSVAVWVSLSVQPSLRR